MGKQAERDSELAKFLNSVSELGQKHKFPLGPQEHPKGGARSSCSQLAEGVLSQGIWHVYDTDKLGAIL